MPPNTIRDVDLDDPCENAKQPDEKLGVQCEDYTIVELPAKLEGTTEVVSASSEGGSVETCELMDEELMGTCEWLIAPSANHCLI